MLEAWGVMYARAVCRRGRWIGEPLPQHLAQVGRVAALLAEAVTGDGELAQAAALAGLLHDVGKALYQRPCRREGDELTFPHHEAVGAAVAQVTTAWLGDYRHLLTAVVRPVYLHHQGLRGVAPTRLDGLGRVADVVGNPQRLAQLLGRLLQSVEGLLDGSPAAQAFRGAMRWVVEHPGNLAHHLELVGARPALLLTVDEGQRHRARALTAILMMADNYVAGNAAEACRSKDEMFGGERSRYVEDVTRYVERVCPRCAEVEPSCM